MSYNIELNNISYKYPRGKQVFQDFSCVFEEGNIYGVIGKNGIGKTTLGKLILNLIQADAGMISMNGVNMKTMTLGEIGQSIGYVYQNPAKQLFASSVYEELAFPLLLKGEDEFMVEQVVTEQLKQFDLFESKDKFPFYLSQGEKQRLVIAGILLRTPKWLIMDEPTTSLDITRKAELKKILLKLNQKEKIGMIIISHDYEFLDELQCHSIEIKEVGEYEKSRS